MIKQTRFRAPHHQSGAVLVVAMIFLIIMTLLAVSGMGTTSLEERMASNAQETTKAFQAAETGLSQALANTGSYDLTGTFSVGVTGVADTCDDPNSPYCIETDYGTDYLGTSPPLLVFNDPELLNSISCYETANFNLRSTGHTTSGVSVEVNGGAWQLKKIPGKC
ncbi:MAG: hypothetical protein CMO26_11560 [Thiotrichales bacterium]|nr:hypothetical protein [Thiotrichales bacterium]|tara:strand:+ start:402 stop:896 length:495 start_codon:yes stop_codon:yes gene_type:complete